ncbi:MAG: 16S rRNA (cytosine(967)-C(5))-methyltransferase RsmB [Oscillospiraceae bacterium]
MKTAREVALLTLSANGEEGAWTGAYLNNAVNREHFDHRESALALRLCYGVLQNRALCDFYLSQFCTVPLRKLENKILNAMRLGVYQILFLDKIPISAAVNESVNLAKKYGKNPRSPGLVNAVLREVVRHQDKLPTIPTKDPIEYLSIRYSHPKWLVKEIYFALKKDIKETEACLNANNTEASLTLQINPLKATPETLKSSLENQSRATPHPWLPGCLEVRQSGSLEQLAGWQDGLFWVQDPAAKLAVMAAAPQKGWKVLDACAAPGGKSFAAAALMENTGSIFACDIHKRKLQLVEEGAARLGFSCIQTEVQDAGKQRAEWEQQFDLVIADLPCSGLGVIRKKPDIRYHTPEPMEALPSVQKRLLRTLSRYVKPGGTLLYSTCTILTRENEDVVAAFLDEHSEFSLEAFSMPCPNGNATEGMLTLWPQVQGTDGFFIARMRRKAVE